MQAPYGCAAGFANPVTPRFAAVNAYKSARFAIRLSVGKYP